MTARWERCRESRYGLFDEWEQLRHAQAAQEQVTYSASDFRPFLPSKPVQVGETWSVDREAVILFLRQLHPGARSRLHHSLGSRPGTWACLRAASAAHFEIMLRAHAEFTLEGDIRFSPAQFEGRLLIGRETGALVSFQLSLPSRNTNVDVAGPSEYSPGEGQPVRQVRVADIGWVPRFELVSEDPPQLDWTSSISDDEARALLSRRFYEFAEINWLPFEEAVVQARRSNKPLFAVLLFGSLDDESC